LNNQTIDIMHLLRQSAEQSQKKKQASRCRQRAKSKVFSIKLPARDYG
jgi:hypothetical protein